MCSKAILSLFSKQKSLLNSRHTTLITQRYKNKATSFPDYYLQPVYRKELQATLIESGELSKLGSSAFKPPASYQTCSVYHDDLVNKFINHVMEMGKKSLARSLVEKGFENIKRTQIQRYHTAKSEADRAKIELDPKTLLHQAVNNCKPLLQLYPVKRGGIVYQVPGPLKDRRSLFLSIKWILDAINEKERTIHFPESFAREIIDAANNTGRAVKRKQDMHKQCEANRAYAHYRWSG